MATDCLNRVVWITFLLLGVLTTGGAAGQLAPGVVFTEQPADVVVVRGGRALLHCATSGTADVVVTWLHDGVPIVTDGQRRRVLVDGTLVLQQVSARRQAGRRPDVGAYRCRATAPAGTILSRLATVSIAVLRPFSSAPRSSSAVVGEAVVFNCEIHGVPAPDIRWEKDKQPLPHDSRYTTFASGSLEIRSVASSDAGGYRCVAANIARTRQSGEARLTVDTASGGGPRAVRILNAGEDLSRTVGETVVLQCSAAGLPAPYITWTRDGHDGSLLDDARFSAVGQASLRITDLLASDSGVYVCSAGGHGHSSGATMQTKLTVLGPPQLLSASENVAYPLAFTVRFVCRFAGSPPLRWTKNGAPVASDGRVKVLTDELLIQQAATNDTAIYQCWTRNDVAEVHVDIRLLVTTSDDTPDAPQNLRGSALSSTRIELSWTPSPPKNSYDILAYSVHYLPTEGGAELQKVEAQTQTIVEQLWAFTSYTFYVVAYNTHSASYHSNKIIVRTHEYVPVEAPDVQVMPYSANALRVTWSLLPADKARGVIDRYRLFYRKHGTASQHVVELAGDTRQHVITDLEANQRYEVRVEAATAVGFSELQDKRWPWVSQEVSRLAVLGPPTMVARAVNTTAIRIVWTQPVTDGRLPILGYKLTCEEEGKAPRNVVFLIDVNAHTLHNLAPGKEHTISLLAFNQAGNGTAAVRKVTTNSSAPPSRPPAPRQLEAVALTSRSIELQWRRVTAFEIVRYTVRYELIDARRHPDNAKYVTSYKTSFLISGLVPYGRYKLSVSTHTASAQSNFSAAVWCHTQESLPSAPQELSWELSGPGAVHLRWRPPVTQNGVVVAYVLLYSRTPLPPDKQWLRRTENGTQREVLVSELQYNTVYLFKLRAVTGAGPGPFSRLLRIHTKHSVGGQTDEPVPSTGKSDNEVGIIIGVCIGGSCIIICTVILLLRSRCLPSRRRGRRHYDGAAGGGSYADSVGVCVLPRVNGNGHVPSGVGAGHGGGKRGGGDGQQMDSFLPMTTRLDENEDSDTKGGHHVYAGLRNGFLPANGRYINEPRANGRLLSGSGRDAADGTDPLDDSDDPAMPLRGRSSADEVPPSTHAETPLSDAPSAGCSLDHIARSLDADDMRAPDSPVAPPGGDGATTAPPRCNNNNGRPAQTVAA